MSTPLREVIKEVSLSGLPFETVNGSRHVKIVVCGEMCGIWPRVENGDLRAAKNVRAQVRRCVKKHIDCVDSVHRTM